MVIVEGLLLCSGAGRRSYSRHAPLPSPLTRFSFTNFSCIWVLHNTHCTDTWKNTHIKAIKADKMTRIEMQHRTKINCLWVKCYPRCVLRYAHFDSSMFSQHARRYTCMTGSMCTEQQTNITLESIVITLLPSSGQQKRTVYLLAAS